MFNRFFRRFILINDGYRLFTLLVVLSVLMAYSVFFVIVFQNYKSTYKQRYISYAISAASSYEAFIDNVFKQTEFIGHKIQKYPDKEWLIKTFLEHHFSISKDLDTTSLNNWITLSWVDDKNKMQSNSKQRIMPDLDYRQHNLYKTSKEPWKIHFGELHSTGFNSKYHFIPISFGVTNNKDNFIGALVGNIYIANIMQYIKRNIGSQNVSLIILDKNRNLIGQLTKEEAIANSLFKNIKTSTKPSDIEIEHKSEIYLAQKDLQNYPFTVIVGGNKSAIYKPLYSMLMKYFLLSLTVIISVLLILESFYKKVIAPISKLSNFAEKSENDVNFSDTDYSEIYSNKFKEVINLRNALIKMVEYKKKLKDMNKSLLERTGDLENITIDLKNINTKLYNSYKARYELLKNKEKYEQYSYDLEGAINNVIDILFPEIYSKNIEIKKKISNFTDIKAINYYDFSLLLIEIISRSLFFSIKNDKIIVETKSVEENGNTDIFIIVNDGGLGNEAWRKEYIEDKDFINSMNAMSGIGCAFTHLDQERGVKYCLMIPYIKNESANKNNIIQLFPEND